MSSRLTFLVILGLVIIGVIGRFTDEERPHPPRYQPEPPREQFEPRRPRPDIDQPLPRRPEPQPREDGRALPPPRTGDPAFEVPIPAEQKSSSGTAFPLDARGTWMTARHVADGCSRVIIVTGPRQGYRVNNVYIHRTADIAILRADRGAPYVALSDAQPRLEQTAYHFGYPKGQPGAVNSVLLGRANMRAVGRYATIEPVLVWAERERVPDSEDHLGGISGGPVFDRSGYVIGTTVAGSMRRGRVFTSDMSSIRAALERANVTPGAAANAERPQITAGDWVETGARLRRQLTVAMVVCLVDQPGGVFGPRRF